MGTFIQEYWWLILFAVAPVLIGWTVRHTRSYRPLLTEELQKHGFEYLSEKSAPVFDTGPFKEPKGFYLIKRRSKVMGIRGEWTTYRIVSYRDRSNYECESWVRLRYEAFRLVEIKWSPSLANRAPVRGKAAE